MSELELLKTENCRLKRENAVLEEEREILKNGVNLLKGSARIKYQKVWKPCTTQSSCLNPVQANYLDRDFKATEPGQKWMGDLTYIPTKQGFLYLTAIIAVFSRKIVGLAMADHMQTELVETAVDMAWQQDTPQPVANPSQRSWLAIHFL